MSGGATQKLSRTEYRFGLVAAGLGLTLLPALTVMMLLGRHVSTLFVAAAIVAAGTGVPVATLLVRNRERWVDQRGSVMPWWKVAALVAGGVAASAALVYLALMLVQADRLS